MIKSQEDIERNAFVKGANELRRRDRKAYSKLRRSIMRALYRERSNNLENDELCKKSYSNRMNGLVPHSISERRMIAGKFARYGIKEPWGLA